MREKKTKKVVSIKSNISKPNMPPRDRGSLETFQASS
jgi:hypothetical protein